MRYLYSAFLRPKNSHEAHSSTSGARDLLNLLSDVKLMLLGSGIHFCTTL